MRGVAFRGRRSAAGWFLMIILLAPSVFASNTMSDTSLWAEFVVWFAGRPDAQGGPTAADESGFTAWLMGRLHIPGG
jgi:hypothetical protein